MATDSRVEYAELLFAMFECIGEGVYALDTEGRVLLINPTASRILGYDPEELVGRVMHDTTHYKHRDGSPFPKTECAGFRVITQGESVTVNQDFFVRKDGSFLPVSYTASPIRREGRVLGAVVAFQDLSARLGQEAALRKAEEHLRLVYRASEVGTWEWDVDSDALTLSPEAAEIVGLANSPSTHPSDFSARTIFYDSDRRLFESTLRNALGTNKEFKAEFRIRHGQEVRWVLITGKAFYNLGSPTVLGILIDTTQIKAEEETRGREPTGKKRPRARVRR